MALQNNDTQGAMMYLDMALSALGGNATGGGMLEGGNATGGGMLEGGNATGGGILEGIFGGGGG
jgi:hypothetical protein